MQSPIATTGLDSRKMLDETRSNHERATGLM